MITVQLQEADYVSAVRLHRRSGKMMLWTVISIVCYVVAGVATLIFAPADLAYWAYFLFGMAVFLGLFTAGMYFIGVPRGVRRRFRQQKDLSRQYSISWNDEKLTIDGDDVHAGIRWTDFLKWREADDLFLLYTARILFRIIPKRAFSDQAHVSDFSRLLGEKIGSEGVIRKN